MNNNSQKGFSLIEVILYISLLTLMLSSSLSVFYYLTENSQKLSDESLINDEAEFILLKIDRLIREASVVVTPSFGGTSDLLSVAISGDTFVLFEENGEMLLRVNGSFPKPLNNSLVKIENPTFQSVVISEDPPVSVMNASFSINEDKFKISRLNNF